MKRMTAIQFRSLILAALLTLGLNVLSQEVKAQDEVSDKMIKELNLSADQQEKIKTINQTYKKKFREAKEAQPDKNLLKKDLKVLRKERDKEVKALLTKEQNKMFVRGKKKSRKARRSKRG